MKKNIIFAVAAVSALLLTFSCTKQDETPAKTFKAVIAQELTKTTVGDFDIEKGGYPIFWSKGDQVRINGTLYSALPDKEDPSKADLEFVEGSVPEAPYIAVFPEFLYNSKTEEYELPREQKYVEGEFNAPMVAVSKSEELYFKSICGVICFNLTGEGTVKQIQITSNNTRLSGPFEPDMDGTVKMELGSGFDYITLNCKSGVALSNEPQKFYVYLPENYYTDLDIRIFDLKEKWWHFEMEQTEPFQVSRGVLYNISWDVKFVNDPEYDPHSYDTH